jgi:serine phosphatase RsbU (regulator of sigma subunit)/HAMP domain-containing protein
MKNCGIAFKLVSLILVSVFLVFFLIGKHNSKKIRKIYMEVLEENAKNLSFATLNKIESVLAAVEKIPQQIAHTVQHSSYRKDDIVYLTRQIVENHPEIYGATIAFEPNAFAKGKLYFAPYYFRGGDNGALKLTYMGSEDYNYFDKDWYKTAKELKKPGWSEPYFDEGAGNIVMTTYSVPFYKDELGKQIFMGVVTADVSLSWLEDLLSSLKIAKTGYTFLVSQKGAYISHPVKEWIMKENIFELSKKKNNSKFLEIAKEMVAGKRGFTTITDLYVGKESCLYYAPLIFNGWSLGAVFPKDEMMAGINDLQKELFIYALSGLGLLFLIIAFIARSITQPLGNLAKATEELATGNLDAAIPANDSQDEVGRLGESFRFMQQSLKKYIEEIKNISRLPGENPNPVFRVGKVGQLLYANLSALNLLESWNIKIGDPVPAIFHSVIEESFSEEKSKGLEIERLDKIFTFEIMPVIENDYVNVYGRDVTETRQVEEKLKTIAEEKDRIEREMETANLVQKGFLPENPPDYPGLSFAAHTAPAKFVGGDFYDFITLGENHLGMVLGDVSGKGVSAALYMARLMSDFRYASMIDPDPEKIMRSVNGVLAKRSRNGMFATALFLLLDMKTKKINISNAGHHSILIKNKAGDIREAGKADGIPLGILENAQYEKQEIQLCPGDIVIAYSDGAIEPINEDKQHFGMERFSSVIAETENSPNLLIANLQKAISNFTQGTIPFDDLTLLVFKV